MAYDLRSYSGEAQATSLLSAIGTTDTSFQVASTTSSSAATWLEAPGYTNTLGTSGNFVIAVDFGTSTEEKILCSAVDTGLNTITVVTRGYDGSSAQSHAAGAVVVPVFSAQEAYEANKVVSQTLGLIGASGDLLVGTGLNALAKVPVGPHGSLLKVSGSGAVTWTAQGNAGDVITSTGNDLAWSSSVPPYLLVSKATGAPTITSSATAVPFNNTIASAGTAGTIPTLDTSVHNGRITINQAGIYKIKWSVGASQTTGLYLYTQVVKNPGGSQSAFFGGSASSPSSLLGPVSSGGIDLVLAVNDTLEIQVTGIGASGASVTSGGTPYTTWASVTYDGPAS